MEREYVVVISLYNEPPYGDSMGQSTTYYSAFVGRAHGPSQAAKETIDTLTVDQAQRLITVRVIEVSKIPVVTSPKIEVTW